MYKQTVPRATRDYARFLVREQDALERRLRRSLRGADSSFASVAALVAADVGRVQARVAASGQSYSGALLGEVAQGVGRVSATPLVGVTGAGVLIEEILSGARIMSTPQAMQLGFNWALQLARSAVGDTARQSVALGMGTREATGYVRALVGKTCSRCAILAGRIYSTEDAFLRHPQCDCQHIPFKEGAQPEGVVDSQEYFDSLSEAEQDAVFTKAGAEAIREGADINQVVNSRRGMSTVTDSLGRNRIATTRVFGQDLYLTSEGTTRRGFARARLNQSPGGKKAPRLMPESISKIAGSDREMYLKLLKRNGYLF